MNITFNSKHVYKLYDSEESNKLLTLRFSPSDYSFDAIKLFFDTINKEDLDRIIKTNSDTTYITTYEHYTDVIRVSIEKANIMVEKTEDIVTLDNNGQEVTTPITTTDNKQIDLIVVSLKYENPTDLIVAKLNQQINPSINIATCSLDELKMFIQKKNSDSLEAFLEKTPLLYSDGKHYGVSKIDREEMYQQYSSYELNKTLNPQIEDFVKWHSKGEKCVAMPLSDFAKIALAVYSYAEPYYETMQEIKETIFTASTKDDLLAIKIFGE